MNKNILVGVLIVTLIIVCYAIIVQPRKNLDINEPLNSIPTITVFSAGEEFVAISNPTIVYQNSDLGMLANNVVERKSDGSRFNTLIIPYHHTQPGTKVHVLKITHPLEPLFPIFIAFRKDELPTHKITTHKDEGIDE